ncbi:MAG: hypothetical protein HWD58_00790 [Bacteroidota bacterium]|nr:MAG: hypothetical protein HWD58_00790 [Bacteroidota bacterium]
MLQGELIREPEVLFWNTRAEKAPEKSGHLFPHPEHRSEYTASRCIKLIPIDQSHRYFIVHRNYNESPIQAYYWLDATKKTVYRKWKPKEDCMKICSGCMVYR